MVHERGITEANLEYVTLAWFESLDYLVAYGPDISPGSPVYERQDYDRGILVDRLRTALESISPNLPSDAIDEAVRKVTRTESPSRIENNRRFYLMPIHGVDVSYMEDDREVHGKV